MRFAGVVLFVLTVLAGGLTLLWAYGKAYGTEWDICPGAECYSGWFGVTGFATLTVVLGFAARRLLRGAPDAGTDRSDRRR